MDGKEEESRTPKEIGRNKKLEDKKKKYIDLSGEVVDPTSFGQQLLRRLPKKLDPPKNS